MTRFLICESININYIIKEKLNERKFKKFDLEDQMMKDVTGGANSTSAQFWTLFSTSSGSHTSDHRQDTVADGRGDTTILPAANNISTR